jgi:polysaccharide pyruvyl transferase WcaK-like protein
MKKEKILILGSYGRGNVGDDAFLLATIKLFKNFDIVINSANDDLIPSYILEKITTIKTNGTLDLVKKVKLFFQVKYIVYGGGDLWVELYGDKYPRQSLWKMFIMNLIGKLFF